MNQNYDKAKLLHRLLNEENARRIAFGQQPITMQQFIQLNQTTEEEVKNSRSKTSKSSYRPPSYRQNRPLSYNDRVLLRDAGRGAVTGITQAGNYTKGYLESIDFKGIADEGVQLTTQAGKASIEGIAQIQTFLEGPEMAKAIRQSDALSKTVIGGITDGIQKVYSQVKDTIGPEDAEKIFKQMSRATGAAKQGLEGILTSGDAAGINDALKTNLTAEDASMLKDIGMFFWNNLPSWDTIWEGAKSIVGFLMSGEVPEEDLLDVKLKF